MTLNVDQILIRKVGGWNLISVGAWRGFTDSERDAFIEEEAVQFFSGTTPVSAEEAQSLLGLDRLPEPKRNEKQTNTDIQAQEIYQVKPVDASYRRRVIEGPSWVVERFSSDQANPLPFGFSRGRSGSEIYRLDLPEGVALLCGDLLADSLGVEEDATQWLSGWVVEHFRINFFEINLGDRSWGVTSSEIRESLEFNPYVVWHPL